MIGIVDVGGGTRGIFGAGVLDRCMDEGIVFDLFIGVSAGSANGAAYCASQRGRNYRFYHDYAFRQEYMGFGQFRSAGSFINMDYIYSVLSNSDGEDPLDYDRMLSSPTDFEIVATNALTGEPTYFNKRDMPRDRYDIIKASCSVPVVNKPYPVEGVPYYDGGVSDPVPIRRAFERGCDRVVLILTKPKDLVPDNRRNAFAAKLLEKTYPEAAKRTGTCNAVYTESVRQAIEWEKEGKVLIVAPDDIGSLKTLSKDASVLDRLYKKGFVAARTVKAFVAGAK